MGNVPHDSAMPEVRQNGSFAREPRRVLRPGPVQHLQRDGLAALAIERFVDVPHTASASVALDLESVGYDLAGIHAPPTERDASFTSEPARRRVSPQRFSQAAGIRPRA
jgi:hypothetical protein